jgi:hypothetical protein
MFPELVSLAPPPTQFEVLKGHLSQIAPGVWVSGLPEFEVPSHVLCRLVPGKEPGTYTFEPEPYPGWVRMTDDIGRRLGVLGLAPTTLRRLLWMGEVEHIRPSPGCIFISIESLLNHFARTANDCEKLQSYWTTARREKWKQSYEPINEPDADASNE